MTNHVDVIAMIRHIIAYRDEYEAKLTRREDGVRAGIKFHDAVFHLLHGVTADDIPSPAAFVERPTHRHRKRGSTYTLIGIGKMQAENWRELLGDQVLSDGDEVGLSVDMREVAIYRSVDDGSLWVRPREEFEDGRFEALSLSPGTGEKDERIALERALDFIETLTEEPLLTGDDIEMTLEDVQANARIELASIRKSLIEREGDQ